MVQSVIAALTILSFDESLTENGVIVSDPAPIHAEESDCKV